MNVLVDTSVWSLARRGGSPNEAVVSELRSLIADARAVIIGPVRHEILSGITRQEQFERLRQALSLLKMYK